MVPILVHIILIVLQSIQDWMLAIIVLILILIDFIILITYTTVVGSIYSGELDAKVIVNAENPKDVEGVSGGL